MRRLGGTTSVVALTALLCVGVTAELWAQPAPLALTASATGASGQIVLAWQAPSDPNPISGYNIYWDLSGTAGPSVPGATPQASLVTATGFTTALPPSDDGQTFGYWVTTVDSVGESQPAGPAWAASYVAPGQPVLGVQLGGYGAVYLTVSVAASGTYGLAGVSVSAVGPQGSAVVAFLPLTYTSGPAFGSGLLPSCGWVSLTAQAVDLSGNAGALSLTGTASAPCGPSITSFAPDASTVTGETLAWSPFPGQAAVAYIVSAGSVTTAADPLPLQLTVTSQTSFDYSFPPSTGNLLYRIYAVDPSGVTSPAASCCLDSAYSFAVPQFQSFNAPGNVTFSATWGPFTAVGPNPASYILWGSSVTAQGSFVALSTVAASSGGLDLPVQDQDLTYFLSVTDGAVSSSLTPPASSLLYAPALLTPTGLSAAPQGSAVVISWPAVPAASGYSIFRTDLTYTGGAVLLATQSAVGGANAYTDSGSFAPGGAYPSIYRLDYAVQAYLSLTPPASQMDSALSASLPVDNPAAAPATFLTGQATGVSSTVALAWGQVFASPGPPSAYDVFYSTQSPNPFAAGVTSTSVSATLTALTVSTFPSGLPLTDGVLTWFWVAGDVGNGPGAFSNAVGLIPHEAPLAPTLSAGVLPFGLGVSLTVALTDTPDVPLSLVDIFESPNLLTPVASLDPAALSLTLSAALFPCGVPETLSAQVLDIAGDTSTPSGGVWLRAPCSPTVQATTLTSGSLTLNWSAPPGGVGDSYDVYASTSAGRPAGFLSTPLTIGASATQFTAPPSPGQSQYYRVYAVDPFGVTAPASAQVGLLAPPSALSALPSSRQVALSWSPPPAADTQGLSAYEVFYSSAAAFVSGAAALGLSPGATALTVAASVSGLNVTGLKDFTPYVFAVASLGGSGASVSGSASGALSVTPGLLGPALVSVATSPLLATSVAFQPVSPATLGPTSTLLAQWNLGSYTQLPSSVFTLYEATDATASPQTFNSITPVASTTAGYVSITAGAPGPAWYFVNVTDAAGTDAGGGDTLDARTVESAYFAPNLSATALTLLAPASDGRVTLAWVPVPFADAYAVYRATQDLTVVSPSGGSYSVLATSTTPAVFSYLASVSEPLTYLAQSLTYVDAAPVDNACNSYEVVPSLALPGNATVFGLPSNAVTTTPRVLPGNPGYWQGVGGSGYFVTAVAEVGGQVFLEWTPSGDGDYPVSSYSVFRGFSPQSLTLIATVPAVAATQNQGYSVLPSAVDADPPQPLAGLIYGVSATDSGGYGSASVVTATVGTALPWSAPQWVPGLCTGYCSSGWVTLSWAPAASGAGTFPFAYWEVQRVVAEGAVPEVIAAGLSLTLTAGDHVVAASGLTSLAATTLSDESPVAGSSLYVIAAVDQQGKLGMPLAVSVTVPVPSYRLVPLSVTGLSAVPAVAYAPAEGEFAYGATLHWNPNAAADSVGAYEVFRQDANGSNTVTALAAVSYPPFTDLVLPTDAVGSWVTYTVTAVNHSGVSGTPSAPLLFQLVPPAPSGLGLSADIPAGVSLSPAVGLTWPDVLQLQTLKFGSGGGYSGAYNVYRDGSGSPLPGCVGLSLSAACTDLSPAAAATYQVESVIIGAGGPVASALSAPFSLSLPAAAPASPGGLVAQALGIGVSLTWSASTSPDALEYWIYRSSAPVSAAPPYGDFLARVTGTAFLDAGTLATAALSASTQTEGYYAVAAASPFAVGAALTVTALWAPPVGVNALAGSVGAPSALTATVSLAWQPSLSGALVTGYNVWRSAEGPSGFSAASYLSSVAGLSYTDELSGSSAGLTNTVLSYTVVPEGSSLVGAPSAPLTVTAYDLPTTPYALAGDGLVDAVDFSWKPAYAAQGVTGYAIAWNVLAGGGGGLTQVAAAAFTDWTVGGLVTGQQVALTVQALNSAGASPVAGPVTATASAQGPPPVPVACTVQSGFSPSMFAGAVGIALSLSDPAATSFAIYRSPALGVPLPVSPGACVPLRLSDAAGGGTSPFYLTTVANGGMGFTDTSVVPLGTYSYAATAVGPGGVPGAESVPLASAPLTVTAFNTWAAPSLSGTAGNSEVSLSWNAPGQGGAGSYPLAGFRLYRMEGGAATLDPGFPMTLPPTQTTYTDDQVTNGLSYAYALTCLDGGGYESLPAAFTASPSLPLAPPQNLIAMAANDSVSLEWVIPQSTANSQGLYNVYRRLSGTAATYGPPQPNLFHVGPSSSSFAGGISLQVESLVDAPGLPTSPPDLVTECYAIAVVDPSGEGPKSPDLCVTPFNPLNPTAFPGGANWNAQAKVVPNPSNAGQNLVEVSLVWPNIPPAGNSGNGGYAVKGYAILRSQNGGAAFSQIGFVTETALVSGSFTDTNQVAGQAKTGVGDIYEILPVDTCPTNGGNFGFPYDLKSVVIPSFQNALYVFRNSFDPMAGGGVPVQCGLQQSGTYWIKVFTLNGEYVATIIPPTYSSGTSSNPYASPQVVWNGKNSLGSVVASGVYLIHLQGPGFSSDARVAVIK